MTWAVLLEVCALPLPFNAVAASLFALFVQGEGSRPYCMGQSNSSGTEGRNRTCTALHTLWRLTYCTVLCNSLPLWNFCISWWGTWDWTHIFILRAEVQINFRLPARLGTDRATMPHYSSWWDSNPQPSVAISYNCSLSIPRSSTSGGALPDCATRGEEIYFRRSLSPPSLRWLIHLRYVHSLLMALESRHCYA